MFAASDFDRSCNHCDIDVLTTEIKSAINESYQICRQKATELLVWLLSDTDRCFNPEIPHSLPVAYAMKGYSLTTTVMRKMHNDILQACFDKGLDVVCSCFDGQWLKFATRDDHNRPLTQLQLQCDVWDQCRKEKRETIINHLSKTNMIKNFDSDVKIDKSEGVLYVSCPMLHKIFQAIRKEQTNVEKNNSTDTDINSSENDDVLATLPDEALDALLVTDEISTHILTGLDDNPGSTNRVEHVGPTRDHHMQNEERQNETMERKTVSDEVVTRILLKLKNHQKVKISKRWEPKSIDDFRETIGNSHSLNTMTHDEINIIIDETIDLQLRSGTEWENLGNFKRNAMH